MKNLIIQDVYFYQNVTRINDGREKGGRGIVGVAGEGKLRCCVSVFLSERNYVEPQSECLRNKKKKKKHGLVGNGRCCFKPRF